MRIALITTNDYYSKVTLKNIVNSNDIDFFVKVNIKKSYKMKMLIKGIRKSIFYVLYLFFELFKLKKLERDSNIEAFLSDRYDYIIDDINTSLFIEILKEKNIDTILFIRPALIIKKEFLEAFPNSYNLHNTLLPKYRGLGGVFQTLRHNEKILGITIHKINEKLDAGEIVLQKKIKIKEKESLFGLTLRSYQKASDLIPIFLDLCRQEKLQLKVQDEINASSFSWPNIKDLKDFLKSGHTFF